MPRPIYRLSDAALRKTAFQQGRHSDGGGLYLSVTKQGTRHWIFLFKRSGKRTEIGLGSARDKTLAVARQDAADARALLARGIDPLAHKRVTGAPTLSMIAGQYADAFEGTVKPMVAKRWRALPRLHFGDLADLPVNKVDTAQVATQMTLLQARSMVIAAEVRPYLERVLDFATVKGHRSGDNPARLAGNLALVLPAFSIKSKHHKSMPYSDVPTFYSALRRTNSERSLILQMIILTGARSTEARLMTWGEVDMAAAIWTIPAGRMKGGVEHVVPLSKPALLLLESLQTPTGHLPTDLVFTENGKRLHNAAPNRAMEAFGGAKFTPHGFRSSFSVWAAEQTEFAGDLIDRCLAHLVGNEVTRAYQRSTLVDRRRIVMNAWATYVTA